MKLSASWIGIASLAASAVLLGAARENAQACFERGRALFGEHDDTGDAIREAAASFRRALELNPRHAASAAYLGLIAAEEQHWTEAESRYRGALGLDPDCAEARVGLAHLRLRDGRLDEARALLREAVVRRPKNRLALVELASVLSGENFRPTDDTWREAIRCWETLVRLDRNDRDSHYSLAGAYRRFSRWARAEREYRDVLRIGQTPDDSDVWVYGVHGELAEVLEMQGKLREAIAEWRALAESEGAGEFEIANARGRIRELEWRLGSSTQTRPHP